MSQTFSHPLSAPKVASRRETTLICNATQLSLLLQMLDLPALIQPNLKSPKKISRWKQALLEIYLRCKLRTLSSLRIKKACHREKLKSTCWRTLSSTFRMKTTFIKPGKTFSATRSQIIKTMRMVNATRFLRQRGLTPSQQCLLSKCSDKPTSTRFSSRSSTNTKSYLRSTLIDSCTLIESKLRIFAKMSTPCARRLLS